jgi:hypothetical protein
MSKPFQTLDKDIILEHMKKVIALDGEVALNPECNILMILEYHLQLAAVAIVAAGEYDFDRVSLVYTQVALQLREACYEELKEKPSNIMPGNDTVN